MQKQKVIEVLAEEFRQNGVLRHKLGIRGSADAVPAEEGGEPEAIVFEDGDGRVWALAVVEDE